MFCCRTSGPWELSVAIIPHWFPIVEESITLDSMLSVLSVLHHSIIHMHVKNQVYMREDLGLASCQNGDGVIGLC
jgi:hypothetical protein